jgi:2-iminobutanoate/2-iminopropanoate deaminase
MAEREVVQLSGLVMSTSPLSPGIKAGGFVFVSGHVGRKMVGDQAILGKDVGEQTRFCLDNVRAVLEAAGSSLEKVVKTTVFLTDIATFQEMNAAYQDYFPQEPPARSTVQVSALARPDLAVEIEAVALA